MPGTGMSTAELYQTLKEELIPIVVKLLQRVEEDGRLQDELYKTNITLKPNPDKENTMKENYKPLLLINIDAKILNKII